MRLSLFSIFDRQALIFSPPFVAANDIIARRFVKDEILRDGSLPQKYPEDYDLFRVSGWSQPSGESPEIQSPVSNQTLELICSLSDLIER